MSVIVSLGNGSQSTADADLIFGDLYGPLPRQLIGKPAIINQFNHRKALAEGWVQAPLAEISKWGKTLRNTIYVAHLDPAPLDLTDLHEFEEAPRVGHFPIELARRLLSHYGRPGMTVWDGACGRGTVGMACIEIGLNYIGTDIDPARVQMARKNLGV